ncbi:hypothetical protein [Pectobacterium polaris]|uniref:hypothetical protein n=2 Tax=Pectobacterium TaxID=122277 RepID=UPI0032E4F10E
MFDWKNLIKKTVAISAIISGIWGFYNWSVSQGKEISSERLAYLEKLNADYEKSLQFDGPGLINSLRESADAFRISASERKSLGITNTELTNARIELEKYKSDLKKTKEELYNLNENFEETKKKYADSMNELQAELASYKRDKKLITLKTNNSQELLGEGLILGLQSVTPVFVIVRYKNYSETMYVGQSVKINEGDQSCLLSLIKFDYKTEEASFQFSCSSQ